MPSRNTVRQDLAESYYRVYARGVNRGDIFRNSPDKDYFLYLLARYLSAKPQSNKQGYCYPHFRGQLELLSYCLMGNHFHLLFYQIREGALSDLMKSIMVAYSAYFNRKYALRGPLFESRFKAVLINKDDYLLHISRYIHLNPRSWKYFPYSSLAYIRKGNEPDWLQTGRLLSQHVSRAAYLEFVGDYEQYKRTLDEVKRELVDL